VGKILVVDNDFGVRRLLVEAFLEDDYEVEMAANGVEALRLFTEFEPDLIMLDMRMPVMNGIETLTQLRALGCRAAVILMTYYGDIQNMEQAKELGILCYITKPFDLFELRERVKDSITAKG